MPNKDLVELVYILDRSGSMSARASDVRGGYNRMIADQKKEPGKANVTLVLFDDQYDKSLDGVPLEAVPELTERVYFARGMTALLDAIGKTVNAVGARLSSTPEDQRPRKVIVTIMTDGLENQSVEFTGDRIREMITHQREKYGWDFTFLGANQDAILTAKTMGIPTAAAMTFNAADAGTVGAAMGSASAFASNSRRGLNASYSAADRVRSMTSDKGPRTGSDPVKP